MAKEYHVDSKESRLRNELAEVTREVYRKGYTSPLNGNMSVRLDEKHI